MPEEQIVQPEGAEETPKVAERRDVFDDAFKKAMESRKMGSTRGRSSGKQSKAPPALGPEAPEVVETAGDEQVPETVDATPAPETEPPKEEQPPKWAKGKTWEEEAKSRYEAEQMAHTKAEEAAETKRQMEAQTAELQALKDKVNEITAKSAEVADQEIVALVTKTLQRMAEVDPEIDPKEYYQTLGKDLAEAIKQINSAEARKVAREMVKDEIAKMQAEQAVKDEAAKVESKKDSALKWAVDQAAKSGLDMSDGSWEARQFWRIFNNPSEIPGDLSLADGVKAIIKMVRQEKEELVGKGIKVAKETQAKQDDQQPMGRGAGEQPPAAGDKPYQKQSFGDLLNANLDRRKMRARR